MTKEKAIKALKWFKDYNEEDYCGGDRIQDEHGDWYYRITEQDFEAFDMAIKALEQEPTTKNDCAEQNGCITCSLNDGDDCCRKLYEESMQEPTTKNDLGVDCISRIETIDYLCKHCPHDGECFKDCDEIKHLRQLPSVTPQEPRKGHWIDREVYDADRWKCSECGRTEPYKENYCPNCGAKMVESQEVRNKE